jgi:hypothetical protein
MAARTASRLSRLKTWLKHAWLSRLPVRGWFQEWYARFARPRARKSCPPLTFRPGLSQLEPRFAPDDPFGFLQGAVLGTGLLSPSVALLPAWSGTRPQLFQFDTATENNIAVAARGATSVRPEVGAAVPAAPPVGWRPGAGGRGAGPAPGGGPRGAGATRRTDAGGAAPVPPQCRPVPGPAGQRLAVCRGGLPGPAPAAAGWLACCRAHSR